MSLCRSCGSLQSSGPLWRGQRTSCSNFQNKHRKWTIKRWRGRPTGKKPTRLMDVTCRLQLRWLQSQLLTSSKICTNLPKMSILSCSPWCFVFSVVRVQKIMQLNNLNNIDYISASLRNYPSEIGFSQQVSDIKIKFQNRQFCFKMPCWFYIQFKNRVSWVTVKGTLHSHMSVASWPDVYQLLLWSCSSDEMCTWFSCR